VALRNGVTVNANLLRHWMKLGHWQSGAPTLLPVTVLSQPPCADVVATTLAQASTGTVGIELCATVIPLSGQVDVEQLTTVLDALRA
jgi:transposase